MITERLAPALALAQALGQEQVPVQLSAVSPEAQVVPRRQCEAACRFAYIVLAYVLRSSERKRLFCAHRDFLIPEHDEHPHLAPLSKPPVEQGGGERVLNLLGDVFRGSQNVTDKKFVAKLERGGIEYTVRRIDAATCIEVGRFCYRFNEQGQSRGGWINNMRGWPNVGLAWS
jgi:hypothetical protein